jgi:hypothetical protein
MEMTRERTGKDGKKRKQTCLTEELDASPSLLPLLPLLFSRISQ